MIPDYVQNKQPEEAVSQSRFISGKSQK